MCTYIYTLYIQNIGQNIRNKKKMKVISILFRLNLSLCYVLFCVYMHVVYVHVVVQLQASGHEPFSSTLSFLLTSSIHVCYTQVYLCFVSINGIYIHICFKQKKIITLECSTIFFFFMSGKYNTHEFFPELIFIRG